MDTTCGRPSTTTALCIAAALTMASFAAFADTIILKEEVYVKGPKVLLGDVAEIDGDSKEFLETVEVAPAALPGDCRRVNASLVMSLVKHSGIEVEDLQIKGARAVRATTLHRDVPRAMIAESLRAFIEAEMPWDPLDTDVEVIVPVENVVVPDGEVEFAWRPNPQYRYIGTGAFRGRLAVAGQVQKSLLCKATVEAYGQVVVARNDISRGKPLVMADLETEMRRLSTLKTGTFQRPEELAGLVARTSIFPGQVITSRKVMPRRVIKRNQIVIVEARLGALHLQSRARARSDACEGDLVVCENHDSKAEFQGIARKDGVVIVP